MRAGLSQLCLTVALVGSCSDRVAEIPLDLEAIKLDATTYALRQDHITALLLRDGEPTSLRFRRN